MKLVGALFLGGLLSICARAEKLGYHDIQTNAAGLLTPWYSPEPSVAFDHTVGIVWNFWNRMESCPNGVKYYLQHQVWKPEHDSRGLGGDQLSMALSAWQLLQAYSGDPAVLENMRLIADYYLTNGFSSPNCAWPNMPFPYNTDVHSGKYDGDMRAGKGVLQPDKAGAFGIELLDLYKITRDKHYLAAAIGIANTLVARIVPGDADHSPWPFRVNAYSGQTPTNCSSLYTANWTGALRLMDELIRLKLGNRAPCLAARAMLKDWINRYPATANKWGPFFEDVTGWSDTEINADTMAWYWLENPQADPAWKEKARAILDWSAANFGTNFWASYGVTAIQEQTAYRVPGNSHTSRHASVQLLYAVKTGDHAMKAGAIRQLSWATYMVDEDGRNRYPHDDIWLTDGYGDYIRHYLRAMGAFPELAPVGQSHLLKSSSVITRVAYAATSVRYATYDPTAREVLRVAFRPSEVQAGRHPLKRLERVDDLNSQEGFTFEASGDAAGVLRIQHHHATSITVK